MTESYLDGLFWTLHGIVWALGALTAITAALIVLGAVYAIVRRLRPYRDMLKAKKHIGVLADAYRDGAL